MKRGLAAALGAVWLLAAAPGRADDAQAQVDALAREAKALMAKGRVADACMKLADAARVRPTLDASIELADCYDRAGQVTSAWQAWKIAAEASARADDPREARARERVAALEPLVPRLVVDVRASDPGGLEIRRDGVPVGREQWGKPVVVDPGEHVVTATAPGKKSWYATAKTNPNGATISVLVPELEDAVAAAPSTAAPVLRRETIFDESVGKPQGNTERLVAVGLGALSVVSLGLGIVFGLEAKLRLDESNQYCRGNACEDPQGVAKRDEAKDAARVSTVTFGVGIAAAAGGLLLYFLAPRDEPARAAILRDPGRIGFGRSW